MRLYILLSPCRRDRNTERQKNTHMVLHMWVFLRVTEKVCRFAYAG